MAPSPINLADVEEIRSEWADIAEQPQADHIIIEKLGQMLEHDPTMFNGPGGDVARAKLDEARDLDQRGDKRDVATLLFAVFAFLYGKYDPDLLPAAPRHGGRRRKTRRGRKSRRKSLRQRK
jgi:hypothetical protein